MSDWTIDLERRAGVAMAHGLLVDFLGASWAWKHLSKPARAAVEAAYPDGRVEGHPLTLRALERHGFTYPVTGGLLDRKLTEPGKTVARWMVKP